MFEQLPFDKLSGAGNDFIVVAQEDCRDLDPGWLARRLCTRALSLGADGLIVVGPAEVGVVHIRFYNPDGSRAEMCGNGSRCAARYAVDHRLAGDAGFVLATDSGELPVVVRPDGHFEVVMPQPAEVRFNYMDVQVEEAGERLPVHALWVGPPHAVVFVPAVERIPDERLIALGRRLRYHERFPAGTNVNFAEIPADGPIRLRTYERGVEDLTKACGTGSTATAVVAHHLLGRAWPVDLTVDGGRLSVDCREGQLWLRGDARLVARGVLQPEAVAW